MLVVCILFIYVLFWMWLDFCSDGVLRGMVIIVDCKLIMIIGFVDKILILNVGFVKLG